MHNAELESRIMNAEMPKPEEDKLIQMCENRLILRNTVEARSIIHQLVQALKKNRAELNITEKAQTVNGNVIERAQEDSKEQQLALSQERELRVYYQKTVMKFLRDSKVVKDHPKYDQFEGFNENIKDYAAQMEFKEFLEKSLQLTLHLVGLANKIHGT